MINILNRSAVPAPRHPPARPIQYHPLRDKDFPPEARGAAFTKWCSSYFRHGPSRGFLNLAQRDTDGPSKLPTVERMSPEELLAVAVASTSAYSASGPVYDSSLSAEFGGVLAAQTEKALFDPGPNVNLTTYIILLTRSYVVSKIGTSVVDRSGCANLRSLKLLFRSTVVSLVRMLAPEAQASEAAQGLGGQADA
ncbi:hypothetical protein D9615_007149 [Tricholomella constricta]|uniref:Uncharacterized protein n=1 Tax=Tricholomella constricta TaxID=117010 RepID=A0A8H5H8E0_9AGAR|nr:hypothetical protein D9615_007149 [Tricholomella constricta]